METAEAVRAALAEVADAADAVVLGRYFHTEPGGYGDGDVFIGVRMPVIRRTIRPFRQLPLDEIDALLDDSEHEHRMAGLLILVARYPRDPEAVVARYLAAVRRRRVDNWDLVDASAEYILGPWFADGHDLAVRAELAADTSPWVRRVAMVSTFASIQRGDPAPTREVAGLLEGDPDPLVRKSVAWMRRESAKLIR